MEGGGGGGVDLGQFRRLGWGRFMWTIWEGEEWVDHGREGWDKNLYGVLFSWLFLWPLLMFNPSLALASEKIIEEFAIRWEVMQSKLRSYSTFEGVHRIRPLMTFDVG